MPTASTGGKSSGRNKAKPVGATDDVNGTMLQTFHWWSPSYKAAQNGEVAQGHWLALKEKAPELAKLGITSLWTPPFGKGGSGTNDVGYAVFSLYDLGEFDQKGGVPTKYGTKQELLDMIQEMHKNGVQVYADVVYNQRQGGEERELVTVQEYDSNNRNQPIGEPFEAYVYTNFKDKAEDKYSPDYKTTKDYFDTVGWIEWRNADGSFSGREGVFNLNGKGFEHGVAAEKGNYDFLCAADAEVNNPAVYAYLKKHLIWLTKETGIDGLRLDAVKHISFDFFNRLIPEIRQELGKEMFTVGEHYSNDVGELDAYLDNTNRNMSLFDFPLRQKFVTASQGEFDLRNLFDDTLVEEAPYHAVPFVDNHDLQALRVPDSCQVKKWFRPHAHASILLRKDGYPCVFAPDIYGAKYTSVEPGTDRMVDIEMEPVYGLPEMLAIRRDCNYGPQHDFIKFDDLNQQQPNPSSHVIAWTREGNDSHPASGLAVVLARSEECVKHLYVGTRHGGKKFVHFMDKTRVVEVGPEGYGDFKAFAGECAIYIPSSV
jgi:alpha-amylase